MRNGLKLFGAFDNILLEARVGKDRHNDFVRDYGVATGNSCLEDVITRVDASAWGKSLDTKVFFDAPDWVVESLEKMGVNIIKGIVCSLKKKYKGKGYESIDKCKYSISNNWLFWLLVDYGYRLGENNTIPYEWYQMKQNLVALSKKKKQVVPTLTINKVESESPIEEALLLSV